MPLGYFRLLMAHCSSAQIEFRKSHRGQARVQQEKGKYAFKSLDVQSNGQHKQINVVVKEAMNVTVEWVIDKYNKMQGWIGITFVFSTRRARQTESCSFYLKLSRLDGRCSICLCSRHQTVAGVIGQLDTAWCYLSLDVMIHLGLAGSSGELLVKVLKEVFSEARWL